MNKENQFIALCSGWGVHNLQGHGHVFDVYDRAANLLIDGELVALIRHPAPMSAFAFKIDLKKPFSSILKANERFWLDGSRIQFKQLTISIKPEVWRKDRLKCAPIPDSSFLLVENYLKDCGLPGLTIILDPGNNLGQNLMGQILKACQDCCFKLQKAKNIAAWLAAATNLVGLGVGLTPSGDDFLGGYLAGLFAHGYLNEKNYQAMAPLAKKSSQTTPLGGQFLRYACLGSFSEHIVELISAMQIGEAQNILAHVRKVLTFGSSSGADTLAGLLAMRGIHGNMFRRL